VEKIYEAMTARRPIPPKIGTAAGTVATTIDTILPRVSANLLSGFLETVAGAPYDGKADLPVIAELLHLEGDELFPVADALQMLHLAEIEGGDVKLTDIGKQYVEADTDERKRIFQRQLIANVPLAAHIRRVLQDRAHHGAPRSRFLDELEDHMSSIDAEESLRSVTAWGRYAEAFAYDDDSQTFSLENPT
jgi:NitT/TauT family transport system ATP-binding protein